MRKLLLAFLAAFAFSLASAGDAKAGKYFCNVTADDNAMQTLSGDLKFKNLVQGESKFLGGKKPPRLKRQDMKRCGSKDGLAKKGERKSLSDMRTAMDEYAKKHGGSKPGKLICLCSNETPLPLPPVKPDSLKPKPAPTELPAVVVDAPATAVPESVQQQMYKAPVTVTNPFGVAPKSGLPGDPDANAPHTD